MSDVTLNAAAKVPEAPPRTAPLAQVGVDRLARTNLFSSWLSTALTLVLAYLVIRWSSASSTGPSSTRSGRCRTASPRPAANRRHGACWALIAEKHRFILFGTYPYDAALAAGLCILLFVALYVVSAMRRSGARCWR